MGICAELNGYLQWEEYDPHNRVTVTAQADPSTIELRGLHQRLRTIDEKYGHIADDYADCSPLRDLENCGNDVLDVATESIMNQLCLTYHL